MDGLRKLFDPNVIVRAPEHWPEPGPFVGTDAVMRQWRQMREAWNADVLEPISDFVCSADRVVGRYVWRATGEGPGIDMETTGVWTVRNGKIFYLEFFWDHDEALKAVGLEGYAVPKEPTTPDLEELVRSNVDAYNRRDFDAVFATYSQHAVWDTSSVGLGVYEGRDTVRAFLEDWIAPYEDFEPELEEVR